MASNEETPYTDRSRDQAHSASTGDRDTPIMADAAGVPGQGASLPPDDEPECVFIDPNYSPPPPESSGQAEAEPLLSEETPSPQEPQGTSAPGGLTGPGQGDAPWQALAEQAAASALDVQEVIRGQKSLAEQLTSQAETLMAIKSQRPDMGGVWDQLFQLQAALARQEKKMDRTLRENASFQVQVRGQMQKELEEYQKQQRGEVLALLLTRLSEMYNNYLGLSNKEDAEKLRQYILDDLREILVEEGVKLTHTPVKDLPEMRSCRVLKTIPTDDPSLHGKVAASYSPSFSLSRMILVKETLDLFKHQPPQQAEAPIEGAPSLPVNPETPASSSPQAAPAMEQAPEPLPAVEPPSPQQPLPVPPSGQAPAPAAQEQLKAGPAQYGYVPPTPRD